MKVQWQVSLSQALAGGTVAEKSQLQAEMQRHIQRNLVEGAFLNLDTETGAVQRLYPTETHPQVLVADGYYVLCVDLRGENGASVPADFYIAPRDRGFVVFKTAVNDREFLRRLISAGRISRMK